MMKNDMNGQTAFVCGASKGIGAATAIELSKQGVSTILLARNKKTKGRPMADSGKILSQSKLTVRAKRLSPTTEPKTQIIIIGFLPNRSLNAPIKGATAN